MLAAIGASCSNMPRPGFEYCVGELDGTYAMEDTDSMAIVATEHAQRREKR